MGNYCLIGTEFLFDDELVLEIVVMVVQHCECT